MMFLILMLLGCDDHILVGPDAVDTCVTDTGVELTDTGVEEDHLVCDDGRDNEAS